MLGDILLSQSKVLNIIVVLWDTSAVIDLILKFILTSSLETILEHGNILNPLKPVWDSISVDEESSHDHQGDDENWDKSHSKFHVGDENGNDESVGGSVPVDKNGDKNEHPETISLIDESNSEVGDSNSDSGVEKLEGEFG